MSGGRLARGRFGCAVPGWSHNHRRAPSAGVSGSAAAAVSGHQPLPSQPQPSPRMTPGSAPRGRGAAISQIPPDSPSVTAPAPLPVSGTQQRGLGLPEGVRGDAQMGAGEGQRPVPLPTRGTHHEHLAGQGVHQVGDRGARLRLAVGLVVLRLPGHGCGVHRLAAGWQPGEREAAP